MALRQFEKLLLVNPPGVVHLFQDGRPAHRKHCTPPLGLAYLAASVLEAGYEVEVLDVLAEGYNFEDVRDDRVVVYGLPMDQIVERACRAEADLIGMSMLFSSSAAEAHRICAALKRELPNVPIVMGGQHPTGA